jgi:hypothetical protein
MAAWRHVHRQGEDEYEIGVEWDDEDFVKGTPSIRVHATVRRRDWKEPETLAVTVSIIDRDDASPDLVINVGGKEIFGVPLADLLDESQIIDRIPAWLYGSGDPVTGCLLRAGLSSVVKQVIHCKNETRGLNWYRPRVPAIGQCLKANVGRISARMALRAAKCALSAGF